MSHITRFVFPLCAVVLFTSISAEEIKTQGYPTDARSTIITSGTGLCWHTSDWTPALAVAQCDPTARLAAAPAIAPPEQPAVTPATPAPIPPAAAPALPQKISFSADALFAFDKSELKPEGKIMLNDLVQQLKGTRYETIQATGHTDRIGNAAYNQKLSLQRANAVKGYLISQDVLANRITTEGKGETQPITLADACKGSRNAKLVACLQPDRRVDVEMQGTKTVTSSISSTH